MHFVNIPAQNNIISDEDSDIDDLSDDAWSESSYDREEAREEDEGSVTSTSNTVVGEQNEDEQEELDESTDNSHESHESHDELDDNEPARAFRSISVTESAPRLCECVNGFGWDALIDDGRVVTKEQWQKWQQWVVKYCPLHDPPIPQDA